MEKLREFNYDYSKFQKQYCGHFDIEVGLTLKNIIYTRKKE